MRRGMIVAAVVVLGACKAKPLPAVGTFQGVAHVRDKPRSGPAKEQDVEASVVVTTKDDNDGPHYVLEVRGGGFAEPCTFVNIAGSEPKDEAPIFLTRNVHCKVTGRDLQPEFGATGKRTPDGNLELSVLQTADSGSGDFMYVFKGKPKGR